MLIGVSVISSCLLYSIMILAFYLSKPKIKTIDNKIYEILVIINVFGLIMELTCCYFTFMNGTTGFNSLMCIVCNRVFVLYMLTWLTVFTFYIFYITFVKRRENQECIEKYSKKFNSIIMSIYVVMFIILLILPLYYYSDNDYVYSYGPTVNLLVFYGAITIVFDIFCVIKNRKHINKRQYIPLIALIVLLIGTLIIRNLNPGIILINSTFAFITFLMYHTIENPDAKVIEELNRNKSIIEKSSQGISNFMFKLTTDAKKYINDIDQMAELALKEDNKEFYKSSVKKMIETTKEADMLLNNLVDISAIDVKNIKITNQQYNISKIFEEIKLQNQNKINDNVNFIINISPNLPEKLYGDKIRIKQVLSSLIANAINHTTEGFISLEVNTIIKYDACRLIISVEDSGSGLSLEKVNDILSFNENISDVELSQIDTLDMDLKMIKKVIKMLGGSLLLTSEEGKGTRVTIVLDQIIANNSNTELEEKLTNYNQLLGIQKVLIVDDDLKELNDIENYFDELGIETVGTMYGGDAVDKIRTGQKFDLIILDDEMKPTNAINVLEKLKEYEEIDAKVIIMLKDKKISISKHYMKEGFADYIDKSKLDVEIKRIAKEYLK